MTRPLLLPWLLLAIGCSAEGPSAPVLHDSPVFQSTSERFRLLMPDDYKLIARAELPRGRIDGDKIVVEYQRYGSGKPAFFEVSRRDDWAESTLPGILMEPSHAVQKWQIIGKPTPTQVNGEIAQRYLIEGTLGKERMRREVIVLRRQERGYFFSMISLANDPSATAQFQRVIDSVLWVE